VLWRAREYAGNKPGHVSDAIVEGNSSDVAEENTTIELDDDESPDAGAERNEESSVDELIA